MEIWQEIYDRMRAMGDEAEAVHLMRFFKTGPGEYGEGDRFLGIRVPETRALIREYRQTATLDDVTALVASEWHEVRLAGLLLLVEIYRRMKRRGRGNEAVDFYLSVLDRGNNWDLVDVVAPKILGDWLVENPSDRVLLDQLAAMDGRLWHQRVAVVSTWTLISRGECADALRIVTALMHHPHDLIRKANGWMLREVGKRVDEAVLRAFLDRYAPVMTRTSLRYAIERLPEGVRRHYLAL